METEQTDLKSLATETRALVGIIAKTTGRVMHERLAQSGLGVTPVQVGVLRLLEMQPHTLSELSKLFMLDASTLVPVIDQLEERQMVERRKDPADRRRVPLHITSEGKAVFDSLNQVRDDDPLFGAIRGLGLKRAVLLRNLLRDVLHALPEGESAFCTLQDRLNRLDATQPAPSATVPPSES